MSDIVRLAGRIERCAKQIGGAAVVFAAGALHCFVQIHRCDAVLQSAVRRFAHTKVARDKSELVAGQIGEELAAENQRVGVVDVQILAQMHSQKFEVKVHIPADHGQSLYKRQHIGGDFMKIRRVQHHFGGDAGQLLNEGRDRQFMRADQNFHFFHGLALADLDHGNFKNFGMKRRAAGGFQVKHDVVVVKLARIVSVSHTLSIAKKALRLSEKERVCHNQGKKEADNDVIRRSEQRNA